MKFKLILLISGLVISCNLENSTQKISLEPAHQSQIIELAKRYLALGRFSGSILIDKNDKVLFNQSFGFANHLTNEPFTDQSAFKIGSLSELFVEKMKNRTSQKSEDDLLKELSKELNLSNTYYNEKRKSEAQGHFHVNNGNQGLEWVASPTYNLDSISILEGIKTTPKDLLRLIQASSKEEIALDGYLKNDGFSFSVDKKDGLSIIILSNNRHPVAKEMSNSIKAILSNEKHELPLLRKEVAADSEILKKYAGTYKLNPKRSIKFEASNDSLFMFMGPNKIHLKAQSQNQFFMTEADAAIKFIKDENDKISSAMLLDGFLTGQVIEKINE